MSKPINRSAPGLLLLLLAAPGCDLTSNSAPATGAVRVSLRTTGGDLDPDGYVVRLGPSRSQSVPAQGSWTFDDLAAESYSVELSGLADNCATGAHNPQVVTVSADAIADVHFEVQCLATGISVRADLSGPDPNPVFGVLVNGVAAHSVSPQSPALITRLTPGAYQVGLVLPPACTVLGPNPVYLSVPFTQVVPLVFAVRCVTTYGRVEVTTRTTGPDLDPNGYRVELAGRTELSLGNNTSGLLNRIFLGGDHEIRLAGVTGNCVVAGENPRTVRVEVGLPAHDTTRVTFEVDCVARWGLAFQRGDSIALARADGSDAEVLGWGWSPSWSPDGSKLAYYCGALCVLDFGGKPELQLSSRSELGYFGHAWRPDGARIAVSTNTCHDYYYCSWHDIRLIDPDGSHQTPLFSGYVTAAYDLTWSSDGTRLAFACGFNNGAQEICAIAADGTGFQRLTLDSWSDWDPAWRPDGSALVFTTLRYGGSELALLPLDGGPVIRLSPGTSATGPVWSPDGATIVFAGSDGLFRMNVDGSNVTRLTRGQDFQPSLRP